MEIRIRLSRESRQSILDQLQRAYVAGHVRLIRRIHALLYIVDGKSVAEIAEILHLGAQTVRDYLTAFVLKGLESLQYKRPPGRPPKLNKTQRKELADLITAGPEAAGYSSACWTAVIATTEMQPSTLAAFSSRVPSALPCQFTGPTRVFVPKGPLCVRPLERSCP